MNVLPRPTTTPSTLAQGAERLNLPPGKLRETLRWFFELRADERVALRETFGPRE